ncbi:hypothetical protein O0I10_008077 [Lichtheimia ornata]|uniref:Yeast cell wall synthesis Kre9/Knh1-like N-terminal domain-containing protein n=1 Tax=Lichtheimia ornata TaxID=688661 RepID=A0AAD7UZ11_9FUNG|nr:uncharacterized protein O0I10_008077 [Lichtheimia ornata]KAJ8656283.1 hypothetical protein O0I10_008077 [Lichtheimia ornata]
MGNAILFTFLFALLAAFVAAQDDKPFYITAPLPGETWKAGDTATIKWVNGLDQQVTINVIEGPDRESMVPIGLSTKVDGSDGSAQLELPKSLDSKGRYAVRIDYENSKGKKASSFSGAFSVSGGSSSSSTSASSTSATSTSATASSSSSSSEASSSTSSTTTSSAQPSESSKTEDEKKKEEEEKKQEQEKKKEEEEEKKEQEKKAAESSAAADTLEDQDAEGSATSIKVATSLLLVIPALSAILA